MTSVSVSWLSVCLPQSSFLLPSQGLSAGQGVAHWGSFTNRCGWSGGANMTWQRSIGQVHSYTAASRKAVVLARLGNSVPLLTLVAMRISEGGRVLVVWPCFRSMWREGWVGIQSFSRIRRLQM